MLSTSPDCKSQLLLGFILTSIAFAGGCGDGRPGRVQVSGQVLIDGEPLSHGSIQFVPSGGRPAVAKLDDQGKFTLSTYGKYDGVIPGEHLIAINGSEELSSSKKKWHAPKKYFNHKTSGLSETISEPTDSLTIEITWDGGEPFIETSR